MTGQVQFRFEDGAKGLSGFAQRLASRLWGRAAGRCSKPGCGIELIRYLDISRDTILGEMAHLIPQSPFGPRGGEATAGDDSYENAILLCPTHHRLVDKAPRDFLPETLHGWKRQHEEEVRRRLRGSLFRDTHSLAEHIQRLLVENYEIWRSFGPESDLAKRNPMSNGASIWELRKLDTIIPNNEEVTNLLVEHRAFFRIDRYRLCAAFIEHAKSFEMNAYERRDRDAVPRFPMEFRELIDALAS